MIVVDVETTGTDPQKHSIVSIGAVDLNHPTEQFYIECRVWEGAHIEQEALAVNGFSESEIRSDGQDNKVGEGDAVRAFLDWLKKRENILLAGQNPLFDLGFLQVAAARHKIDYGLAHRSIDLHTATFMHMVKRGIEPPVKNRKSDINSDLIMNYVGIPAEPKPHKALNGAIWEAEAFSRLLYDRNLIEQFSKYPIPW